MSELKIEQNNVVVPGEELATGLDFLPGQGTYREKETIIASKLGVVKVDGRAIKIMPLTGKYIPKKGDTIICRVTDITLYGWRLDTNSAYEAMLGMKEATSDFIAKGADLTQYFDIGDYMVCKIINVTSQKIIDVTMKGPGLRKLTDGSIISVNTNKVPRIIGKQGSMISLIKNGTGCRIIVGQNGLVFVQGEKAGNEVEAVKYIRRIEKEAHVPGLTDRLKAEIEGNPNNNGNIDEGDKNE